MIAYVMGVNNDIIEDTPFYHGLGMPALAVMVTYIWRVE